MENDTSGQQYDYIKELNQSQRDAVLYTDGPALVIAGAGSGKTRVLTYKIVHLLSHGYEPWRILALTFTNKAAREMRERIEALVGQATASKLWMGTFHSIFSRILRQNADRIGYKRDFTIYDAADSKSLVKTIIRDMDLDDKIYKPSLVANAISTAKNALISPRAYAEAGDIMEADRRAKRPRLHEVYTAYCHRCFVAGAMDFDDLLYYTNVLLRDNDDIRHHYQEYFRYVLVDEYQDTNFAQHRIVSYLTEGAGNLCVVGDDAQSIYSFRGANIRNILTLKQSYPTLKTFKLEQNYRSTQNIINAANSLIDKNIEQIPKHIFSENAPGQPIEVVQSYSDYEESFLVANRVSQIKMLSHDSYEEFAILYRTNAQSRILEESLRKRNIPYRIYGGLSFYQRKEVKDAIAYFRLSVNPDDDEAMRRVINYPKRGIGDTTINNLIRAAIDNRVSMWRVINDLAQYAPDTKTAAAKKLYGFRDMIDSFIEANRRGDNAEEVAKKIITDTALLSSLMSDTTPESISKQENLTELLNGVREFVASKMEQGDDSTSLTDFLGEVSLATDQDNDDTAEERITLMTVHAAKGLEFANVFIVGAEEELFPSAMSNSSLSEIEEERRLMYVAITRAKKFCMISYAASRFRNGQTVTCSPSRFLRDIDPQYLKLNAGNDFPMPSQRPINPIANYRKSTGRSYDSEAPASSFRPLGAGPRKAINTTPGPTPGKSTAAPGRGQGVHSPAELRAGMEIEHERFGRGTISEIDTASADPRIKVEFKNTGSKTLLLKFAHFNIIT
ncbi:MAG: UvrD-helicase domain-containing protein [Pseudoflavonifractor sp.]|nr:UvrD-helicase domain-containing protein [Pseudoflavonifractor sp.]